MYICKCELRKEVFISLEDIFHSYASSTNEVGCIILNKYFEVPYGGDPIVDTTALIG